MDKLPITIAQLAVMINEGFKSTASKEDIKELRSQMNQKFEAVESRLGRIEHLLMEEQKRKIEDLENRMKRLEDALAVEHGPLVCAQLPRRHPVAAAFSFPLLIDTRSMTRYLGAIPQKKWKAG